MSSSSYDWTISKSVTYCQFDADMKVASLDGRYLDMIVLIVSAVSVNGNAITHEWV